MQRDTPVELSDWFENTRCVLETAYLSHDEPWRQSGMAGPEERWVSLRKPIADCVDRSGSFLDIGCANGYLLECILKWTADRRLSIEPYGLDLSDRLVELARMRLPGFADNFWVGNSFTWMPPRRFDFVRTELVYVPGDREREYIEFLLDNHLTAGGRLLIANYMEGMEDPGLGSLPGSYPTRYLEDRLQEIGVVAERYVDGFDPVRGRRIRVAVVSRVTG